MILGHIRVSDFLKRVKGLVVGTIVTDAKDRQYRQSYVFKEQAGILHIGRASGGGVSVTIPAIIELDESLVAFFGLYSGDGAKGSEDKNDTTRIVPNISFSQKEKHLVRFAVDQFRKLFPGEIRFNFSLGEDSAYFMAGIGLEKLEYYYRSMGESRIPRPLSLEKVRAQLDSADKRYLAEVRPDVQDSNEAHLAFYYQHKAAMEIILAAEKTAELSTVGIEIAPDIKISASLRRPFKKGARAPGGSSRSDETHLGGLAGTGELFMKMMHEIEDTLLSDSRVSATGLIEWTAKPSQIGEIVDLYQFFTANPYGKINGVHPLQLEEHPSHIVGKWRQSSEMTLNRHVRLDPLWCYISGLYLAEGSTPKEALFRMFANSPGPMSLGFTSSEGTSIELMLRTLRKLFPREECLDAWKVKVGSQYFPELVMTGLKHGVPMLRGGNSGDGKLRTMEISLAIKEWALSIADVPLHGRASLLRSDYADKYSHVEPTGAGVARIDFWASSTLCRWYFPLLMYTVFGRIITDPASDFYAL